MGRGRRLRSQRAAEAAHDRIGSRRASDAAPDRSSTSPPARSARASAPRSAPRSTRAGSSPTTAPTCCSATASRRKARSGKRPTSAAIDRLDSLCGITDVNALGQSRPTMFEHDMGQFERRWKAFGWHAIVIDGHDLGADPRRARRSQGDQGSADDDPGAHDQGQGRRRPSKDKEGWHGRAFKKGEELDQALAELEKQFVPVPDGGPAANLAGQIPKPASKPRGVDNPEAGGGAVVQAGRSGRHARSLRHRARQARRSRPARRRARRRREELDVQRPLREGRAGALLPELHRRAGDGRRGDGARRARRDSVPVDVRLLPVARRRLRPHGGDQQRRHQARRLARRRVDRRRRAVADGARGSRDVPRRAELHGAVPVRRGERGAAARA